MSAPKGEIKAATLTEKPKTKQNSESDEAEATPVAAGDGGAGIDPLTLNLLLAGAGLLVLAGGITGALVIAKRKRG